MDLFKMIDAKDYPLDERDHPLDERDVPLELLQYGADLNLSNMFDISDQDYNSIDNISPQIDQQMNDEDLANQDLAQGNGDEEDINPEDTENPEDMEDMDQPLDDEGMEGEESEGAPEDDANFQGVIRTVKGANLVYKRQAEDNTFTELWIINIGNDMKKESQTKRAILAGTDIDAQSQESQDGKQHMELYTVGNVQFIELTGLPS